MAKTKTVAHGHHNKRYGTHKKHTHSYKKVYWPYIPMLVMLFVVLVFGAIQPQQLGSVLAAHSGIDNLGLLTATNAQRVAENRQPLTANKLLSKAATAKVNDMKSRNYWSHQTPDGEQPWKFIEAVDYEYQKAGENLAYGFSTNSSTVTGWMNSQSHRENMLDPTYTEVGFGIVEAENYLNQGPQTIVVAFYAAPQTQDATQQSALFASTPTPPLNNQASIPFIASMTDVYAQWMTLAIGVMTGLAAGFMIARHGLRLKRIISSGEHFIMHHPLMDLSVTGFIIVGSVLLQSAGFVG